jgi:hypothetical protein
MAKETIEELPAGFGGNPSGSLQKYETWKFRNTKDNEVDSQEFRILPMMKSLLSLDDFGLYWAIHYGWNGVNTKDPSKPSYHPFLCIEEKGYNGMISQECPVCNYRNPILEKLKSVEKDTTKAVLVKNLKQWKDDHGRDAKFRIPCINRQGQYGIFLAPYGLLQSLKQEMKDLKTQTYPGTTDFIRPIDRKGVWFKFVRRGRPSPTSDKAEVCRVVNGDGYEIKDFHTITNEQLTAAMARIPDLVELRDKNRISIAKMEALVALDKLGKGNPDPVEVDRILKEPEASVSTNQTVGSILTEQEVPAEVLAPTPPPAPPATLAEAQALAAKVPEPEPAVSSSSEETFDELFN